MKMVSVIRGWRVVVVVVIVVPRAIEVVIGCPHVGLNQAGGSVLKARSVVKPRPVIIKAWPIVGMIIDGHEAAIVKKGFVLEGWSLIQETTLGMIEEAVILRREGLCGASQQQGQCD